MTKYRCRNLFEDIWYFGTFRRHVLCRFSGSC